MQIVKSSNNFSINIRIWGHLVTIPYQTAFQNKVLTNIRITVGGPASRQGNPIFNIRIRGRLVTIPYQTAFQNKVLTNIRITMGGPAARASQDLDSDVDICLHLEAPSTTSESGVFW